MKSILSDFLLLGALFLLSFTSCLTDHATEPAPQPHQLTGFATNDPAAGEKYLPAESRRIDGEYIVVLEHKYMMPGALVDTLTKAGREDLQKSANTRLSERTAQLNGLLKQWEIGQDQLLNTYTEALCGFAARLSEAQVARLIADERVASVTENQIVEMELPQVDSAAGMPKSQTIPCGITRHNGPGTGPASKWIWIVDSGISLHSDLNVVTNTTYAKSFVYGSPFYDCIGHGTHVAGTAAAKNNSFGVVGMSAGAAVVPVRVFGCSNEGTLAAIIGGINHVALYDEPGDVCNLSLGGFYGSGCATYSSYKTAVTNLAASGTWVVIAAGNNGANAAYYEPGCLNGTRIITVANMTCSNSWNFQSNYGIGPIDWIAVGTNVLSTWPGNQYYYLTGTSMSAPHVAGIVHVRQANPKQCGSVYRYNVAYQVACR